jgi:hypothetical protein
MTVVSTSPLHLLLSSLLCPPWTITTTIYSWGSNHVDFVDLFGGESTAASNYDQEQPCAAHFNRISCWSHRTRPTSAAAAAPAAPANFCTYGVCFTLSIAVHRRVILLAPRVLVPTTTNECTAALLRSDRFRRSIIICCVHRLISHAIPSLARGLYE